MIRGIGTDVVSVARLTELLERFEGRAAQRLFSPEERRDCDRRASRNECLAARFAAKEAFVKALGTGLMGGMRWRDMVVRSDRRGRPELQLDGIAEERFREVGGERLHLSLSHDAGIAVAVVVIEG